MKGNRNKMKEKLVINDDNPSSKKYTLYLVAISIFKSKSINAV